MEVMVSEDLVSVGGDMGMEDMDYMEQGMYGTEQQVFNFDELLSSPVFVGGTIAAILVLGILFGLLAAKCRIKKGIDLYED